MKNMNKLIKYIFIILILVLVLNNNYNDKISVFVYAQYPTPEPTVNPTRSPTYVLNNPTPSPTAAPTFSPTPRPTNPTKAPSRPTGQPTRQPSSQPTSQPSSNPTQFVPTPYPSTQPSGSPTTQPSSQPSRQPTSRPTMQPSGQPSSQPSNPSGQPTNRPSMQPSRQPSSKPSSQPSSQPSRSPTRFVSFIPTTSPTLTPTLSPTLNTAVPSPKPTIAPSTPTGQPSSVPSQHPTTQPSSSPSSQPTSNPISPSGQPSSRPSRQPSRQPTSQPSRQPSCQPTGSPTSRPSYYSYNNPARTRRPSREPTLQPIRQPTSQPSTRPTGTPTLTCKPTAKPTAPTFAPSSFAPTFAPSSFAPTFAPTTYTCTDMTGCCQNQQYISLAAAIVNIPDNQFKGTVTRIGYMAFKGCTSLTSITIPASVIDLGDNTFQGCTSLTTINIIPKYLKLDTSVMTARPTTSTNYGGHSFNCKRFSDGLVLISYQSPPCDGTLGFSNGSPGLTHPITGFRFTDAGVIVFIFHFEPNGNPPNWDVFIPVNLKVYNLNSMIGTSYNQNGNTVLTDTAARINTVWTGGAPYGTGGFLQELAFKYAGGKLMPIEFTDALWNIPPYFCQGCSKLTSVNFPVHITQISTYAFESCSLLSYVSLGDYLTLIGDYAFANTGLTCIDWDRQIIVRIGKDTQNVWPFDITGTLWNYRSCPTAAPTPVPTAPPTIRPTIPTGQPTGSPSRQPSGQPSRQPSSQPSSQPSGQPSASPTKLDRIVAGRDPTGQPSSEPSNKPSSRPTTPTSQPTSEPSKVPSRQPTSTPTSTPTHTSAPTGQPSSQPSSQPSAKPSSWLTTQTPTATFIGAQFSGNVEFIPFTSNQCDVVHMKIVFELQRNLHITAFKINTPGITSGPCYSMTNGKSVKYLNSSYSTPFVIQFVEGSYLNNYGDSYLYVAVSNSTSSNYFSKKTLFIINIDRKNGLRKSCGDLRSWDVEGVVYNREKYLQTDSTYATFLSTRTGAEWARYTTNQYLGTLTVSDSYSGRACIPLSASIALFPPQQHIMTEVKITLLLPFAINVGDIFIIKLPGFTNNIEKYPYSNYSYDANPNYYSSGPNVTLVDVLSTYNGTLERTKWTASYKEGSPPYFLSSSITITAAAASDIGMPITITINRFKNHLISVCGREANYTGFTIRSIPVNSNGAYMAERVLQSKPIGQQCNLLNDCSGHGSCDYCNNRCNCYDGFGSKNDLLIAQSNNFSPDCSSRVCPVGRGTGTIPRSGIQGSSYHREIECSNNGLCDRSKGVCKCYAGYYGSACDKKKSTCEGPNGPQALVLPDGSYSNTAICSGRGVCLSIKTLQYHKDALPLRQVTYNYRYYSINSTGGFDFPNVTAMNIPAKAWDDNTHYACVCDSSWPVGLSSGEKQQSEYFGPLCQFRHCPGGDDPVTTIDETNCTGKAIFGGDVGQSGNLCHVDCSNRGICDYSTGLCACFQGYYGSNCGYKQTYGEATTRYNRYNSQNTN